MSNNYHTEPEKPVKETASLEYFQRSRTIAGFCTAATLAIFIAVVYFTAPLFFTNFWLAPLLLIMIVSARSFGSWDAYAKMRKQTDVMQKDLDSISKAVEHEQHNK